MKRVAMITANTNSAQRTARGAQRKSTARARGYLLMLLILVATAAAQGPLGAKKTTASPPKTSVAAPTATAPVPDTAKGADTVASFEAAFMAKYGKAAADSLVAMVKNDYLVCVGDPELIGRTQLFRWKTHIDSMVADKGYPQKFKTFVTATGMKAQDVRPCEPIVFSDHIERQLAEMDRLVSAQRAAKEKAHSDSVTIAAELRKHSASHADILSLPPGISKNALRLMLERDKIRYKSVQKYIQADDVMLDSVMVTVAFYFDDNDKYNGYEFETEAVRAETIDKTARVWADKFAALYGKKLGKPANAINRVGFKEIKQGKLSITSKWDKDKEGHGTSVIVGLAVHESRYYAKVMVNY